MHSLQNKTVLLTGASSRIGESIARKLAGVGARLVLVAPSEAALTRLAGELTETYGAQCIAIATDLSRPDFSVTLQNEITSQNIQIDVLINNASFGSHRPFATLAAGTEFREMAVNISSVVGLTQAFIPGMLARKSGAVLNIAAIEAIQPGPYRAVFATTKAFVVSFTEVFWAEFHSRGVHVAALCPGPVKVGGVAVNPEYVAELALKALQVSSPTHITGFKQWLLTKLIRYAPRRVVAKVSPELLLPSVLKS